MKKKFVLFVAVFMLALGATVITQTKATAAGSYHYLKTIKVGGEGRSDYAATDEAARRLYVTHDMLVIVIDTDKDEVVGEITDTPGVHGFAIAPELGLGFSSNGMESKASIVDLKMLKTTSKVDTEENPDGILYVPGVQEVYVFNRNGEASVTVFDAKSGKVITTIKLPGTPESAVADTKAGRVYANIDNKNEVVAIDTTYHKIVSAWPTAPGAGGSGMAIDLVNHRLFIGCDNNLMVMMDSTSGKVVGTVPICEGVDATLFDPGTNLAFAPCGKLGNVTIAKTENPDKLSVVQTIETARGARTMALDLKTHKIYVATLDYQSATSWKAVPNSFHVLVYGTDGK